MTSTPVILPEKKVYTNFCPIIDRRAERSLRSRIALPKLQSAVVGYKISGHNALYPNYHAAELVHSESPQFHLVDLKSIQ